MFEGETTITFSKEASYLMMSQNVSTMFGIPLEVSDLRYDYEGLKVTFAPPQPSAKEKVPEEPEPDTEPEPVDVPAHPPAAIQPQEGNVF